MKKETDNNNQLIDRFERQITYLRISLTDRCNLRCSYCYDSLECLSNFDSHLSNDQLITMIKTFAALGIDKVRFTGGEPLLRRGIIDLIRKTSDIDEISQIGITTNGVLLERMLVDLIKSGLNRINVSLDTLQKNKFVQITGVDKFDTVYAGIMNAIGSGAFPMVKVNTVIMKGINDDEIPRFAEWALSGGIDLRFIEFMPTHRSGWGKERFLPEDEIKNQIGLPLEKVPNYDKSHGPAESFMHKGSPGRISFISAVSRNFCHNCNRIRLTSSGDLIGCLFSENKVNISALADNKIDIKDRISQLESIFASDGFRRFSSRQSVSNSQPLIRGIGG